MMKDTREKKSNAPARPVSGMGVAVLALSALLMAGAASCRKDKDTTSPTVGVLGFRATVETHSGDGKTSLDGNQVKWVNGDIVAVYNHAGKCGVLKAKNISDDGQSADLMDLTGEYDFTGPYRAVYPCPTTHGDVAEGQPIGGLSLGSSQQYVAGGFANETNPMAAYGEAGATELNFNNLCGLLKVSLIGDFTVKRIEFTSKNPDDILWGDYSVTFDESNKASIVMDDNKAGNKNVLTMECNKQLVDDPTYFYFVLPPNTLANGFKMEVFKATNEGDLVAGRLSASNNTQITASQITSMKDADMTMGTDLSEDCTKLANCYIAPACNHEYSFPCTVKGNGVVPTGNCTSYLNPEQMNRDLSGYHDADIVWQTYNDATTNPTGVVKNVMLIGDYVHFKTGDREGNALIAVMDENNTILWSWHIWCVNENDQPHAVGTHHLMDRNLGALSTVAGNPLTCGLFYQWGRKDPSLGLANYLSGTTMMSSSTLSTPAGQGITSYISGVSDGAVNLENATRQPWRFVISGVNTGTNDWFNNIGGGSNGLWNTPKTMYDPCPPGWKVPDVSTTAGNVWGSANDWSAWDDTNKGMTYNDGGVFYPALGYRAGEGAYFGRQCQFVYSWSCTPFGSGAPRFAYSLLINNAVYPAHNDFRSYGLCLHPVEE